MDNGAAYLKYRQENPEINTFITTYEHLTMFPEQLTETEIIVLVTFSVITLYAVVTLIYRIFFKKNDGGNPKITCQKFIAMRMRSLLSSRLRNL